MSALETEAQNPPARITPKSGSQRQGPTFRPRCCDFVTLDDTAPRDANSARREWRAGGAVSRPGGRQTTSDRYLKKREGGGVVVAIEYRPGGTVPQPRGRALDGR